MRVYKESTINDLYMTLRNKALRNKEDTIKLTDLFNEFEDMRRNRYLKLDKVKEY